MLGAPFQEGPGPAADLFEEVNRLMGIGVSLFLLAVGAILTFALGESTVGTVNLDTVGIILMIVGAIGLLLSMLFWSSFAPFGSRREERTVVRDRDVV